jgi:HTH-type transcriptional regulator / antitoxin HigA
MTAVAEREYAELLRERRPHVIRTRAAYMRVMREVQALAIRGDERSKAETQYFLMLCALVGDYERSIGADKWPRLEPREMLRELMELKGITQAEVAHALGDRASASSILSGRRSISKAQAKILGQLFHVDAGLFI